MIPTRLTKQGFLFAGILQRLLRDLLAARPLLDPLGIAIETAAVQAVEAKRLLGDMPVLQAIE